MTNTISGKVTLAGVNIENALVRLYNSTKDLYVEDTLTNSSGNYTFTLTENFGDEYHLVVEYSAEEILYNSKSQIYIVNEDENVNFELVQYDVIPNGLEVNLDFTEGVHISIKISGTFVDKPLMIKKAGTFEQVTNVKIGGWSS